MTRSAAAAPLFLIAISGAAPPAQVEISVEGLRSARGNLHVCLTGAPAHFPDCTADPDALRRTVKAGVGEPVRFRSVPPGDYALSVIHDENGNGRLDMFAGIPREGFGFSGNPPIRFGPPKFDDARFAVAAGPVTQRVRVRYIL